MRYKLSKEAEKDLEIIWLYTFQNWSLEPVDYYYDLLMNEIEYLAENPKNGIDLSQVRKRYFRSRVKSHFIFYRISIQTDEIEIIRILHQRMDMDSQLNG